MSSLKCEVLPASPSPSPSAADVDVEPGPDGEGEGEEDWEKRRMEERDRLGWARREDSRSREIGSSLVRVRERKVVEKDGGWWWWWCEGGSGIAVVFVVAPVVVLSGQVARRICERSFRSWASRVGLACLRPAQETRRMRRSTLGIMPACLSLAKVRACSSVMLLAGGVLGGACGSLLLRK